MTAIDPVTLVVVQNGLQQVASEMDLTFERAAFSPVISEGFDRSDGIYDKDNGDVIAQGELGLPIFVGVMQFTTRAVIDHVQAGGEALRPGDIFIINDPYAGGTHLMDVKMVKPYFYRGRLWAYLSNTGHWPDTGARCRGLLVTRDGGPAGGVAAAAREALSRGRDAARHPGHHSGEYPRARGAHRRHQGPGGRAHRRREAPDRADRPLWRRDGDRVHRRAPAALGPDDARPYREDSRRRL